MKLKILTGHKSAFTLAETLIALTIVGIIAAAVIPLVVSNSAKVQLVSQLQKANNTFTNVINHAQADTPMSSWDFSTNTSTEQFASSYILPHLNIAKNCERNGTECFAQSYTAKNTGATSIDNNYYKVALADGVSMAMKLTPGCTDTTPVQCASFIIDVNGVKKPNIWGRDVFEYTIYGNFNAIVPYGSFDNYDATTNKWVLADNNNVTKNCLEDDEKYCALKIINDGWEMNY